MMGTAPLMMGTGPPPGHTRGTGEVAPELVRIAEQHVADQGAAEASMSERTRAVDPVARS